MVNTPGRPINEKNRRASGGLFLFPFYWAHLPFMDQTTVASIYLGSVGGSEIDLRALLMLVEYTTFPTNKEPTNVGLDGCYRINSPALPLPKYEFILSLPKGPVKCGL
jgi:hypothetical protein